ncbi:hypothetical protein [Enterobacter cloacae]|uniref:hypothetical protein n=1 Tax=Enterobacter cloacae TaxID=550 RepID=UPI000681EB7C|nr:hypothetical protein [Enterobacter cloacae]
MSVNRYYFEDYGTYEDDGRYVTYEDYTALEQKLVESQREFRAADATSENLQMKLEKMAAENAGLKAALNPEVIPDVAVEAFTETVIMDHDWNETSEWSWVENDTDVIRAVLEAIKPETPATASFLAEVRAQGVDAAIEELNQLAERSEKEAPIAAGHYRSAALFFKLFADSIRKGVQS